VRRFYRHFLRGKYTAPLEGFVVDLEKHLEIKRSLLYVIPNIKREI